MDKQMFTKVRAYIKDYQWSNVWAMVKNNKKPPQETSIRCDGKVIVITGATSGIGLVTAKRYAQMGAHLILINRNKEKSAKVKYDLIENYSIKCDDYIADLSCLSDVYDVTDYLLQNEQPIDVLIHNAGIHLTQKQITGDGIEKVLAIHHLAPFFINYRLRKKLIRQDHARIIYVCSEGHRFAVWGMRLDDLNWEHRPYAGLKAYGEAKVAQLLMILKFKDLFADTGVTVNAMHPGAVKSNSGQTNGQFYRWYKDNVLDKFLLEPELSAKALYFLGVSEEVKTKSGLFFNLTTEEEPTPPALDRQVANQLWEMTMAMISERFKKL